MQGSGHVITTVRILLFSAHVVRVNMARFILPVIHDNKNGWGPSHIPEQFKDTPYQPFSKGDRLGKVSEAIKYGCPRCLNEKQFAVVT